MRQAGKTGPFDQQNLDFCQDKNVENRASWKERGNTEKLKNKLKDIKNTKIVTNQFRNYFKRFRESIQC